MSKVHKSQYYHQKYATLKSRGINDNKVYTLTIHKNPVRESGYEIEKKATVIAIKEYEDQINESMKDNDQPDERLANSISRSKSAVLQYAANNEWEYFVTLTFSRDGEKHGLNVYDLNEVKKSLLKFFNNYANRSGAKTDFKYLLVPELHKDGAIHFHGLLRGINPDDLKKNQYGYMDFVPYVEKYGFCSMGEIVDHQKCASYITKYVCKEMLGNTQYEPGMHMYFASKGLKKDELIKVGVPVQSIDEFVKQGKVSFENEYCAKIIIDDVEQGKALIKPFPVRHKVGVNIQSPSKQTIRNHIYWLSRRIMDIELPAEQLDWLMRGDYWATIAHLREGLLQVDIPDEHIPEFLTELVQYVQMEIAM